MANISPRSNPDLDFQTIVLDDKHFSFVGIYNGTCLVTNLNNKTWLQKQILSWKKKRGFSIAENTKWTLIVNNLLTNSNEQTLAISETNFYFRKNFDLTLSFKILRIAGIGFVENKIFVFTEDGKVLELFN